MTLASKVEGCETRFKLCRYWIMGLVATEGQDQGIHGCASEPFAPIDGSLRRVLSDGKTPTCWWFSSWRELSSIRYTLPRDFRDTGPLHPDALNLSSQEVQMQVPIIPMKRGFGRSECRQSASVDGGHNGSSEP